MQEGWRESSSGRAAPEALDPLQVPSIAPSAIFLAPLRTGIELIHEENLDD